VDRPEAWREAGIGAAEPADADQLEPAQLGRLVEPGDEGLEVACPRAGVDGVGVAAGGVEGERQLVHATSSSEGER